MNAVEKKRSLEKSAAFLAGRNPSLKDVIASFAALAEARAAARDALAEKGGPAPETSGNALRGEPLLGPDHPLDLSKDFMISAPIMLQAVTTAFPQLAGEAGILETALKDGRADPGLCARVALTRREEDVLALSKALDLVPENLVFLLTLAVRPCMERLAELVGPKVNQGGWYRNYCPVCGLEPEIGALREIKNDSDFLVSKGGQLWMRCEMCSFEWRFPRVKCPECGADHQKNNEFYESPDDPNLRAYVCPECKAYFPCINTAGVLETLDLDIARIAFLPMEMRLREMGYAPMSEGPAAIG